MVKSWRINMTNEKELFTDHEVRIRLLEKIAEKIDLRFDHMEQKMDSLSKHLDNKINNQFLCILAIVISLFGGIIWQLARAA
jgi:hypothetical protein